MASSIQPRNLNQLLSDQSDNASELPLKCMFCCTEIRVQSFYELAKGDHIKQPGENLSFNIGKKLKRLYDHHAIIKEIHTVLGNGSSATLTLIEFMTSPFDSTPKIREQTVMKNLHQDEIVLIKYRHKTHPPDEIIQRGLRLMKKDLTYNLLLCNCEHIARWCVCGNGTSFQARGLIEHLGMFSNLINNHYLRMLFMTTDDALQASGDSIAGPLVLVAIIIQQLLKSIMDTKKLNKLFQNGDICDCCCKRKKRETWVKFGVVLTLQTGGLVVAGLIPIVPLQVLFGALVSILTVYVASKVPNFMKKICSPFVGPKDGVDSFQKIKKGDVVSWKVRGFYHDGIVTRSSVLPNNRQMKANLKVIHYSAPGIFTKGTVVEEILSFNLEQDELRLHDYTGFDINEPNMVIEKARKRLGETKFGFTNRSAHFCLWAKLKDDKDFENDNIQQDESYSIRPFNPDDANDCKLLEYPVIVNHHRIKPLLDVQLFWIRKIHIQRPHTSKDIEMVNAKIRDDIKPGQLIQFTYRSFPHKAVCTDVKAGSRPSIVHVDIVHYGVRKEATEETFTLDLNKVDVTIIKVHPIYRYNRKDIIRRARAKVGEMRYSLLCRRSSHLAEEIVYKDIDKRIDSFSEIKPGDCITYKYWGLPHEAVIVDVKPGLAKSNNEGHITLVHYALDHLIGTRYIKKEEKKFNLLTDNAFLNGFPGYFVYPDEVVVQRALKRVGERNFHIRGNISSDVVHWAKVVQTPSIITITNNREPSRPAPGMEAKQFLLLPAVGEHYKTNFEKDWIKTWDELIPGMIVGKGSKIGILSTIDSGNNEITIIRKKCLKGVIREVTVKLDLRTEFLDVYRCDPRNSNTPAVSLKKAMRSLGARDGNMGERIVGVMVRTNWEFCENCVLR